MVTANQAKALPQASDVFLTYDLLRDLGLAECPFVRDASEISRCVEEIARVRQGISVVGSLNRDCKLLNCTAILSGGNAAASRMADVFRQAINSNAAAIFLAENVCERGHPNSQDILRRKIAQAGLALRIPLIEDVIVTPTGYHSRLSIREIATDTYRPVFARIRSCRGTKETVAGWTCPACLSTNIASLDLPIAFKFPDAHCFAATCCRCDKFAWISSRAEGTRY